MVPGAPVATSGILFAVPAFRDESGSGSLSALLTIRLSRSPFAELLAVPPSAHRVLQPSRPPTLPPSDSPVLRLLRPPTFPLGSLSAAPAPAFCPHSICEASRRPALRPSRPPTFPLGSLSAASAPALCPHSICEASRRSALCPFRPPPVPSSVSFALRSFFCLARLFLFLTPSSIWMGISGEDFPRGQLFCIFPSAGFQHTLIYLIYKERMPFPYTSGNGSVLSVRCSRLPSCLPLRLPSRPPHLPPEFFSSAASFFLPPARPFCTLPHPSSVLFRRLLCLCSHFSRLIVPSRPNFFRLPHPSPLLPPDLLAPCHTLRPPFFAGRPSLIPAFRPSRHSPIRFFLRLPRPFSRLFPRKFAAPFGKVKALLRASPPELRIGPTPTSALPRLLLRPQSSRHRFYGQNASCRFTMQSQLRQKIFKKIFKKFVKKLKKYLSLHPL